LPDPIIPRNAPPGSHSGQPGPPNQSCLVQQTLIWVVLLTRPHKYPEIHLPAGRGIINIMWSGQPGPPNQSCLAQEALIWTFWLARPHNPRKSTSRWQPDDVVWPARAPKSEFLSMIWMFCLARPHNSIHPPAARDTWSGQPGPPNQSCLAREALIRRFWPARLYKSQEIHLPAARGMWSGKPVPPNQSFWH